jgi:hypothetical protein
MKYIIFEDFGGKPLPVIFPERIGYEELREQMPYATVLAAGLVELLDGGFRCSGAAPELQARSREQEDARAIARHFEPHPEVA